MTYLLQSKLNCEVLYDDLAFEVRWAIAGESIVIQLVAKLGKSFQKCFSSNNLHKLNIYIRFPKIGETELPKPT